MEIIEFKELEIQGAYELTNNIFADDRGCFVKFFEKDIFKAHGINFSCNEDFISVSKKNVIRGMHFQLYHPQIKIVNVLHGKVFDVIVDLRKESKTFGKWYGTYLSAENCKALLIPRGCAHGFLSLEEKSIVSYKCDGPYDKSTDGGIVFNDREINIQWPTESENSLIISDRDRNLITFSEFSHKCTFKYAD